MDIKDFMEAKNVSITVSVQDLYGFGKFIVEQTYKAYEESRNNKYVNGKDAAEMLGVSKSTLQRYKSIEYLIPISIGGKRMYKISDIQKILNQNREAK